MKCILLILLHGFRKCLYCCSVAVTVTNILLITRDSTDVIVVCVVILIEPNNKSHCIILNSNNITCAFIIQMYVCVYWCTIRV